MNRPSVDPAFTFALSLAISVVLWYPTFRATLNGGIEITDSGIRYFLALAIAWAGVFGVSSLVAMYASKPRRPEPPREPPTPACAPSPPAARTTTRPPPPTRPPRATPRNFWSLALPCFAPPRRECCKQIARNRTRSVRDVANSWQCFGRDETPAGLRSALGELDWN